MKKHLLTAAVAALMAMPVLAQSDSQVRISGSLIDWYYYGKDIHTSAIGWHQQSPGNGATIDSLGVGHSTGPANLGLFSLIISGKTSKPLLPEFLIRNTVLYSNCGGLYMGGNEYYSFFGHEVDASANIDGEYGSEAYEILIRKWTWDGQDEETGLYQNVKYEQVGKMYNQATDFAYDPVNDIVYGVFNIGGGDGYKLGTLDMETFKITWISREAMPLTGELRTLACNSKGELYGTDKSGNIYKVSTTDGTLTTIGHLKDKDGNDLKSQEEMVSATFDYRTDKMYWLGYINDGKKSADTSGTNNTLTVAEGGRDTGLIEIEITDNDATTPDASPTGLTVKQKFIADTYFKDIELQYDEEGTLIGAETNIYGKMEMTGIYVDGSIVKPDYDLKAAFKSCPVQMSAGETATVTAKVKNLGLKTVKGSKYTVSLYADGQLLQTIDDSDDEVYTENLKAGQSYTYTFTYTAPAKAGDHTLSIVVTFDGDERTDNNTAEATVKVLSTELLPAPTLEGETSADGVTLTWSDPKGKVVDGAEDYVAFSYDALGAWVMFDGDQGYTQKANNWNASIEYANWSTPKAYIVMDPVKAGFDLAVGGEKFNPHNGNQYFAAWWTAVPDDSEAGGHQVPNDDWMISPRLNGEAQTVSFWAKGYKGVEAEGIVTEMNYPEQMRVLATEAAYKSADDMDLADWTIVRDTFVIDNTAWTEYNAELPAGTRHFALQCCSQEGFVTMIDDIAFTVEAKTVVGYNVYRDGELIATLPVTATTYTDTEIIRNPSYTVTAIYDEGESLPSNAYHPTPNSQLIGDANHDGVVDVADIAAVIDIMATEGYDSVADANSDNVVDVADIAAIIDIMAGK